MNNLPRNLRADIENPAAYERAIQHRIKINAAKTRRKNWMAANPDGQRIIDWLYQVGEFGTKCSCGLTDEQHAEEGWGDQCRPIEHPATYNIFVGDFGKFLAELQDKLGESGSLSEKQTEVVRNAMLRAIDRVEKRKQERALKLAIDQETSNYVGEVGKRIEFVLTVERVFEFETMYGMTYINICRDVNNNVIVYKGSNGWEKGDLLCCKATIKEHSEREGVKQTLISRPTVTEVTHAENT